MKILPADVYSIIKISQYALKGFTSQHTLENDTKWQKSLERCQKQTQIYPKNIYRDKCARWGTLCFFFSMQTYSVVQDMLNTGTF